ncbi:alpha/beta hydrolase [Streptomyces sp. MH60]|uniref:alpha/beta hydrolase n=1 Tax=Streptomyces sp. MH60 TaxID=1940758 RepID=UPI000CEF250A|nr:alpha/beta hydrolase [Streptomyces sp. MH60]PPS70423.1 hypothetical protein BZZ08_07227 [Streptomyces sp. MH60]
MRTVTATAAAVTAALATGAASVAVGRLASDAALKAPPGRPLPTEPRLTVHGTAAGQITLTRDLAALRPGRYGLAGDGSHAVVGPVLGTAEHGADTVVRRLERVTHGTLETGDRAWFTPNLYVGNPGTALDLEYADVEVPGELGPLPAWFLPGARPTWIIAVHGLAATREHALNVIAPLHRRNVPVLTLAYRGDVGAPPSPDGLHHFGETEWRDVDAAARRTPGALLPLAVRAAQGRAGLHADRDAGTAGLYRPAVPTLIFHGPGDAVAPWRLSRRLADTHPRLVALHTVRDAPHGAMWNADPADYEETLRRFMTPLV